MSQSPTPQADPDESRPLLDPDTIQENPSPTQWPRTKTTFFTGLTRPVLLCITLALLLELSNVLRDPPTVALYERVICDKYYRSRGGLVTTWGNDGHCKIVPIQNEVALVCGLQSLYNGLSALLVALPLGILTNRFGQRKAFTVILSGMIAASLWTIIVCTIRVIPVRLVWLTSVFYLCGGGKYTAEMLLATMLVRASAGTNRLRNLYYMYLAILIAKVAGTPLSKLITNLNIWIPVSLSLGLLCTCFLVVAAIPESANIPQETRYPPDSETEPLPKAQHILHTFLAQFRLHNLYIALPMLYAITLRLAVRGHPAWLSWSMPEKTEFIDAVLVNTLLPIFVLPAILVTDVQSER